MTRYLAQNLFASFCFSLTILPALDAEKIDNRDRQLEPDGMRSVGRKVGRGYLVLNRLVGLKSQWR